MGLSGGEGGTRVTLTTVNQLYDLLAGCPWARPLPLWTSGSPSVRDHTPLGQSQDQMEGACTKRLAHTECSVNARCQGKRLLFSWGGPAGPSGQGPSNRAEDAQRT